MTGEKRQLLQAEKDILLYEFELNLMGNFAFTEGFEDFFETQNTYGVSVPEGFFVQMSVLVQELQGLWDKFHNKLYEDRMKMLFPNKDFSEKKSEEGEFNFEEELNEFSANIHELFEKMQDEEFAQKYNEERSYEDRKSVLIQLMDESLFADIDYLSLCKIYSEISAKSAEFYFSDEGRAQREKEEEEHRDKIEFIKLLVRKIKETLLNTYESVINDDIGIESLDEIITVLVHLLDKELPADDGWSDFTEFYTELEAERGFLQGVLEDNGYYDDIAYIEELDILKNLDKDVMYVLLLSYVRRWFITNNDNDFKMVIRILYEQYQNWIVHYSEPLELCDVKYSDLNSADIERELIDFITFWGCYIDRYAECIGEYLKAQQADTELRKSICNQMMQVPCKKDCDDGNYENIECDFTCHQLVHEYLEKSLLCKEDLDVEEFSLYQPELSVPSNPFETYDNLNSFSKFWDYRDYIEYKIMEYQELYPSYEAFIEAISDPEVQNEYLEYTNDLTLEERVDTGYNAYHKLISKLEVFNLVKTILRKKKGDDERYEVAYSVISDMLDKILSVEYKYPHAFYDASDIEELENTAEETSDNYKYSKIMELNLQLATSIANNDFEQLLSIRKEIRPIYVQQFPWLLEEFDKCIEKIIEKIKMLVQGKDEMLEKKITELLNTYSSGKKLSKDVWRTLYTAEYLYQVYLADDNCNKELDYSFISIMYYQALERTLNELMFVPYCNTILESSDSEKGKLTRENVIKYFGCSETDNCTGFYAKKAGRNNKKYILKESIEIGNLGHFLENSSKNDCIKAFLQTTYPNADIGTVSGLGSTVLKVKDRRNDAAHGVFVDYKTSQEDKIIILQKDSHYELTTITRDLLIRILEILK